MKSKGAYRNEHARVRLVRDAVLEGNVHRVAAALTAPSVALLARAREELAELVQGKRHDAVGGVKRLLYAVAVVAVEGTCIKMYPTYLWSFSGCRG